MRRRQKVGVLGATGTVGARIIGLLADHPWFEVAEVAASDRSAGTALGDALRGSGVTVPPEVASRALRSVDGPWTSELVLSALPSSAAAAVERELARRGHRVVSNASTHRMDPDVPLVIPEVNPDHLALLERQETPGWILTNPNCVVAGIAVALAPLHEAFGVERAVVTTFQAISGAGRPGPSAADLLDNVVPWIRGEEEKAGPELRKILGRTAGDGLDPASITVSATATRVPVAHGHLASVSLAFRDPVDVESVEGALRAWPGAPEARELPLAPERPLELLADDDRPQPLLDRDRGAGMTVTVGRVRPCEVLHAKLLVLSHNLVRGAAGAAVLNAELCRARGLTGAGSTRPGTAADGSAPGARGVEEAPLG